jgi:hypothetical protein
VACSSNFFFSLKGKSFPLSLTASDLSSIFLSLLIQSFISRCRYGGGGAMKVSKRFSASFSFSGRANPRRRRLVRHRRLVLMSELRGVLFLSIRGVRHLFLRSRQLDRQWWFRLCDFELGFCFCLLCCFIFVLLCFVLFSFYSFFWVCLSRRFVSVAATTTSLAVVVGGSVWWLQSPWVCSCSCPTLISVEDGGSGNGGVWVQILVAVVGGVGGGRAVDLDPVVIVVTVEMVR